MARYKNTSGAVFTLPDGRDVPNGSEIDLDAGTLAIPGVSQFIDAGGMVETGASMPSPVVPDKPKRGRPRKEQ